MMMMMMMMKTLGSYINGYAKTLLYFQQQYAVQLVVTLLNRHLMPDVFSSTYCALMSK